MLSVQEKIHLLMWDRRYVLIPYEIDTPNDVRVIIIKDPTVEDRNHYLHHRRLEEMKCRHEGVPSEGEVFQNAKVTGFWTDEDEDILKKADDHIAFLEAEIDRQKFPARKKSLGRQLLKAREQKASVSKKENYLHTQSADYFAHEVAILHLLQRIVLDKDSEPFWTTEESFLMCRREYPDFFMYIAERVIAEDVWEIAETREIARHAEWRLVWCLNRENLSGLFNRPVGDLNMNQKTLIYWSRYYDSVFEDPDRPDMDVIEDDEKLDEWVANRDLERSERKKGENKSSVKTGMDHHENGMMLQGEYVETCNCGALEAKGKGLGESTRHANTCPYGTFRKYTAEEKESIARQIYGRNNNRTREILESEQSKIMRHGKVEEQHLRGKVSRKLLDAPSKVTKVYK